VALVRIGKVARAVGLKGHLGVAGSEGGLADLPRLALRRGDAAPVLRAIIEARPQGKLWAVRVEGVADREAAEGWVGSDVLAERDDLGEAGEGLHYWGDLEGLAVVTTAGEPLGQVTGLLDTGAVGVLVVRDGARELLVPLAPYVTVDAAGRRIVVDPPDGLLDLGSSEDREDEG
jgi:16S rRNA processing protein RimM